MNISVCIPAVICLSLAAAHGAFAAGPDDKINYETARFDRKLLAIRAAGRMGVDGLLDEGA